MQIEKQWDSTKYPLEWPNADSVEQQELIYCWWECKIQSFGKCTKHTHIQPPIMLLVLLKWVEKLHSHKTLHTPMSLTAFFMIVKIESNPGCSSIIEWTNHGTMDYSGLFRYKKKWSSHKKGWRNLNAYSYGRRQLKSLYRMLWFQVYDILEEAKYEDSWKMIDCGSLRGL